GAREGAPDAKTFAPFLPNDFGGPEAERKARIASSARLAETASSEKRNRLPSILFAIYIKATLAEFAKR
ncbi:MAG: hypothetical protein IKW13_07780, partial [Thermoguttaceae bacterium]|nr:hypothetical protein [Thermoguttaceae bacterium]